MHNRIRLRVPLLAGVSMACLLAVDGHDNAHAADASPQDGPSSPPATSTRGDATSAVQEVVVTGSRLKNTEYTSAIPIQIISAEKGELSGVDTAAGLIRQTSATIGSFQVDNQRSGNVPGASVDAGGLNVNTVSLRGLGAQRTLVILNGRRLAPAGTGSQVGAVDLNVLPQAAIDRIEVLKDGASSIYGSDAVAGVVNVITKRRSNGIETSFRLNDSEHGGARSYDASALWAAENDSGYLNISAQFQRQDALLNSDRSYTGCRNDLVFDPQTGERRDVRAPDGSFLCRNHNPTGALFDANFFGGTFVYDPALSGGPYPAASLNLRTFLPDWVRVRRAGFPDTYGLATGHETSPAFENATAISPLQTSSLYASGGYKIADDLEAYGELLLNERRSHGDSWLFLSQFMDGTNPNNTVAAGLRAASANDDGTIIIQTVLPYNTFQDVKYANAVAGLRGQFGARLLEGWSWDAYVKYGRSDGRYRRNFIYQDRLNATTGPGVACNPALITVSAPVSTCPSIPWLDPRLLVTQQWTDEERSFLEGEETGRTRYDEAVAEASATGSLFDLPAGPVALAAGLTYRHEKLDDQPGFNAEARNYHDFSTAGVTAGTDSVREVFAELGVPILKDIPLIKRLDLSLSGRYTDYASYGNGTTYKAGLNWTVIPSVKLRATYGTSFRAPTLYELYLANVTFFQNSFDPCTDYGSSSSTTLRANCAAIGLAPDFRPAGLSIQITQGGGAGLLKAETSDALSTGIVWSPGFADLQVAADYFSITVKNQIDGLGYQAILSQCYTNPVFPSNDFCGLVTRDPATNEVAAVNDSLININSQRVRGIDLSANYSHTFGLGTLGVATQASWLLESQIQRLSSTVEDNLGTLAQPRFSGWTDVRFTRDKLDLYYSLFMIGPSSDKKFFQGDTFPFFGAYAGLNDYGNPNSSTLLREELGTPFWTMSTASVRYRADFATLQLGVANLFDKKPPEASVDASFGTSSRIGSVPTNRYDITGRRFFVRVTKSW